ncbi:ATP-binding cassette domain-containing protein [Lachnospiraceae bacterium]|jgi:ABC-type multidrug transport system ATPase subunit|nr:ATP-binding cassette domain-containing protein [uncultured Schaedlerella sp.]MCI8766195.1 ATP-binding cassette domain-containing protein [Ruminococcus sp.]NBI98781.1 ATP-binding cassette domain-containing protein [Lachnospiraceae bacterium]
MKEQEKGLAVEAVCLTKMYQKKAAVNRLDMSVREGEIYGFIGKNGAGKSTTMKMLCGLARPAEGEIRLFGKPVSDPAVRRRMGVLIEAPGLYPNMTARQNAVMKARCMGLADERSVDEALLLAGLADTGKKKVKHFSMGMKQRLGVALAMLGNPDLLILDEPINGLDPEGIRELRRLVLRLHETGKTILISSHILGELSKISTVYGIIKDGQMIEQITSEALEEKCMDYFQIEADDVSRALVLIGEAFPKVRAEVADSRLVRVYGLSEGAGLIRLLVEKQVQVYASGFHHMDLEEYFISRMEGGRADV